MERFEANKKIYHLNPDTFKDSTNDFHQYIMPSDSDGQGFTSLEFQMMKGLTSVDHLVDDNIIASTSNTISPNNNIVKMKKYSFINPYM